MMDTSERLRQLREAMDREDVTAYVVDSGDAHASEYVADSDKRRVSSCVSRLEWKKKTPVDVNLPEASGQDRARADHRVALHAGLDIWIHG